MQKTDYLTNFKDEISKLVKPEDVKAQVLEVNDDSIVIAGERIREGKLVAFPTETVYGLGANALDESAVLSIFKTKGRPLTDPVIVHVVDEQQALELIEITEAEQELFLYLAKSFWPGPLTMVVKANPKKISGVVIASTGFVGIRSPKHEIARKLIKESNRPIAAPSANLFSHISPTSPVHVFNDFFNKDVTILNGDRCEFGMESTVVKVYADESGQLCLKIFRFGSLSELSLREALNKSEKYKNVTIEVFKRETVVPENKNAEAPGGLLTHYSPYQESYLIQRKKSTDTRVMDEIPFDLKKTVLIDFDNAFIDLKANALAYLSLSDKGDLREAMTNFYYHLRKAENCEGCQNILMANIHEHILSEKTDETKELSEHLEAVYDKSFRSVSGKKVLLDAETTKFYLRNS